MAQRLLTRKWILTTILVIAGSALCIRLGFWQLDRLAWRRAFNARVEAQINAPVLDLNQNLPVDQLYDMEYRSVTIKGRYDFSQEIILRNQVNDNRLGVHVFTPLIVNGSGQAILVERGWIPAEDSSPQARVKYDEPGLVTVSGVLRRPLDAPDFGGVPNPTLTPGETHLDAWNYINLKQIQAQTTLQLLPAYIQQAPEAGLSAYPVREVLMPDITEGPHEGYAIQWFSFATILGLGYPFFLWKQIGKRKGILTIHDLSGVERIK
jgi:surfeit locus 1 family protein